MTVYAIPSQVAQRNLRTSSGSLWPDGRRAAEKARLEGILSVAHRPGFRIDRSDRIMTIGSCFARELELFLQAKGFDLPALEVALPQTERPMGTKPNVLLNKYTVHSMENEIRWAFEGMPCQPEDFFLRAGENEWCDSHLVHNLTAASMGRVQERRQLAQNVMAQLPTCRVVVITLGLAEAWKDLKTDFYLNGAPPQYAMQTEPNRFELHVLEYDEILAALERIHALLHKYGHPDLKVLLTVSPVPFKASFSGLDAVTANTYGKSVQRAAAEVFAARHSDVDYFPSYEIVTLSPRNLAYKDDNIHVTPEAIDLIMSTVLAAYCSDTQTSQREHL